MRGQGAPWPPVRELRRGRQPLSLFSLFSLSPNSSLSLLNLLSLSLSSPLSLSKNIYILLYFMARVQVPGISEVSDFSSFPVI